MKRYIRSNNNTTHDNKALVYVSFHESEVQPNDAANETIDSDDADTKSVDGVKFKRTGWHPYGHK